LSDSYCAVPARWMAPPSPNKFRLRTVQIR
jgi:hypothetical protein